jgi:ketosteroid isomerase-like protein
MPTRTSELPRTHLSTVAAIYEAFGRGDVPTVLELMSEDIAFDADSLGSSAAEAGHPLLSPRRGKAELVGFFEEFGRCEVHAFEVLDLMASETQVAVHVFVAYTTPAGAVIEDDEIHRWTFDQEGRAATLKHYGDTARHIAAWFPAGA